MSDSTEKAGQKEGFDAIHFAISEVMKKSELAEDPTHSEQVRKFVLQIDPDASEELQIAALSHDIERAVPPRISRMENEPYEVYKQRHAQRSATITAALMQDHGYPEGSIEKVRHLIQNHELGGDEETDKLRDADSASFFADNLEEYLKRSGEVRTRDKIKLMYERASERTKYLIRSIDYPEEIERLIKDII